MRLLVLPAAAAAAVTVALSGAPAHAAVQTPTIVNGTLTVTGDDGADLVEIRRKPNSALLVEVDVGDDGVVEGTFLSEDFTKIAVNAGGGNDTVVVDEGPVADPIAPATIDGGDGDDTLNGGPGIDVITGGPGADTIDGDKGNDVQQGQNGADLIVWDPGDGSDVVDGGAGGDVHRFNGAGAAEIISLERSEVDADRIELLRNVGTIDMDIVSTEAIEVLGKGGNDQIAAGPDLRGATESLRLHGGDPAAPAAVSGTDTVTGSDTDDVLTGGDDIDTLSGGLGVDTVDGGGGADSLACGGQADDVVVSDPADTVSPDCLVDAPKGDQPRPEQPKGDEPKADEPKAEQPKAEQPAAQQPVVVARSAAQFTLPPFARYGFSAPRVSGSFRSLRVRLENVSGRRLALAVAASDGRHVYRTVRRLLEPGDELDVVLRAPKALRRQIAKRARRGAHVRRPVVRIVNLETDEVASTTPRIRVAKGARA